MAQPSNCYCDIDVADSSFPIEDFGQHNCPEDARRFDRLLGDREYRQTLERIARKNTRGTSVHWEDALQTAQIKVFLAIQARKFAGGDLGQFYRWAAVVAKFAIIDLVRREKKQRWMSLDRPIPGTDLLLSDTIADEFDLLDAVERADLVLRAIESIRTLDRRYPQRGYLKLWQGTARGKTQTQLAADLGITQGAVSKRWRELIARLAQVLELLPTDTIECERQVAKQPIHRSRSSQQW